MRKIRKLGKWVPYELSENSIGRRLNSCIRLIGRKRKKNVLWKIVTDDENGSSTSLPPSRRRFFTKESESYPRDSRMS
uniref:HTH_48 domain-containing protein n=1 Tax=Heterorhabditis bacteriophora TaxID=37862 RepID=A0A1I7X3K1_HETBA